jgi:hypothetical protein
MPRVLLVVFCLATLAAAPPRAEPAPEEDLIFQPFDPDPLTGQEKRLLQAALAAAGDYRGSLDGVWGAVSQGAIDGYAGREFESPSLNLHAAALVLAFQEEVERNGWDFHHGPELGISLAMPLALLGPPETEDGGLRWWRETGQLTVLLHRFGAYETMTWHDAAAAANTEPAALYTLRNEDLLVTGGSLYDGRIFYTRSDRVAGAWATVYLAGAPEEAALVNLIGASIGPGLPQPWELPGEGRLAWIVAETSAFLADAELDAPPPLPLPVAAPPRAATTERGPEEAAASGTGFYVAARTLVTAEHVVRGCARLLLGGGGELALIAADPELDVAVLAAPAPVPAWLALSDGAGVRLGQRLHAAGFPYYSIAGTSLHLTGGNVSSLAGVDDDRRFFSFSAPVQPGNSGGPLIGPSGAVLGVTVARLSESYIAETTGSLPQNVNYALRHGEIDAFLRRHGLAPAPGGLAGFDMEAGAPDGFEAAVVPIVCE